MWKNTRNAFLKKNVLAETDVIGGTCDDFFSTSFSLCSFFKAVFKELISIECCLKEDFSAVIFSPPFVGSLCTFLEAFAELSLKSCFQLRV